MVAIDHIVVVSEDPKRDAKAYGEQFGMEIQAGGKHTQWGTYNYLGYLENDSYLEWIAVYDLELAKKSDNPLIQQIVKAVEKKEYGTLTYALRTEDMDDLKANFDEQKVPYLGPFPGARKKEDGSALSWRMLFPTEEENIPFFIEWGK